MNNAHCIAQRFAGHSLESWVLLSQSHLASCQGTRFRRICRPLSRGLGNPAGLLEQATKNGFLCPLQRGPRNQSDRFGLEERREKA